MPNNTRIGRKKNSVFLMMIHFLRTLLSLYVLLLSFAIIVVINTAEDDSYRSVVCILSRDSCCSAVFPFPRCDGSRGHYYNKI